MRSRSVQWLAAGLGLWVCACLAGAHATAVAPIRHVFVLMLENQNAAVTFSGRPPSPYLAQTLPARGALLPNYYGIGHASLDNYVAMVSGHLHRPITTLWAGTTLSVCPATAPQVALDLQPMDAEQPDGRAMIVADHPWFALHYWNGQGLISHFDTAEEHEVLARFIPKRQPLLRMLRKERAEAVSGP